MRDLISLTILIGTVLIECFLLEHFSKAGFGLLYGVSSLAVALVGIAGIKAIEAHYSGA
jgi:hypothetical protein